METEISLHDLGIPDENILFSNSVTIFSKNEPWLENDMYLQTRPYMLEYRRGNTRARPYSELSEPDRILLCAAIKTEIDAFIASKSPVRYWISKVKEVMSPLICIDDSWNERYKYIIFYVGLPLSTPTPNVIETTKEAILENKTNLYSALSFVRALLGLLQEGEGIVVHADGQLLSLAQELKYIESEDIRDARLLIHKEGKEIKITPVEALEGVFGFESVKDAPLGQKIQIKTGKSNEGVKNLLRPLPDVEDMILTNYIRYLRDSLEVNQGVLLNLEGDVFHKWLHERRRPEEEGYISMDDTQVLCWTYLDGDHKFIGFENAAKLDQETRLGLLLKYGTQKEFPYQHKKDS